MHQQQSDQQTVHNLRELIDFLRPFKARAEAAETRARDLSDENAQLRQHLAAREAQLQRRVAALEALNDDLEGQVARLKALVKAQAAAPHPHPSAAPPVSKATTTATATSAASGFGLPRPPGATTTTTTAAPPATVKTTKSEPPDDDLDATAAPHHLSSAFDDAVAAAQQQQHFSPAQEYRGFPSAGTAQRRPTGDALPRPSGGASYAIGPPPRASGIVVGGSGGKRAPDAAATTGGTTTTTTTSYAFKASRAEAPLYGHFAGLVPPNSAARRASNASPSPGTLITSADGRHAGGAAGQRHHHPPQHLGQVIGVTPSPAAIPPTQHRGGGNTTNIRQPQFSSANTAYQHDVDDEEEDGAAASGGGWYPPNPAPSRSNVLSTTGGGSAPGVAARSAMKRGGIAEAMSATAAANRLRHDHHEAASSASRSPATAASLVRAPSPSGTDGRDGRHAPRVAGRQPPPKPTSSTATDLNLRRGGTGMSSAFRDGSGAAIDSPMPLNPAAGPDMDRVFVASLLSAAEKDQARDIVRRLGKRARFLDLPPGMRELPDEVTHVITTPDPTSEKALAALVSGRTVVDMAYMHACHDCGLWAAEEAFAGVVRLSPEWPMLKVEIVVDEESIGDHLESVLGVLKAGGAIPLSTRKYKERDLARVEERISCADDLVEIIRRYE